MANPRTRLFRLPPRQTLGTPEAPKVAFEATPKQVELIDVITDGRYRFIGFGGGIRGTKTYGCLAALITLCRIFPRSRWAVVRKDLPTIRRNVVPSFNKIRATTNGFVGEINRTDWTATCANGSVLIFFPELKEQDPELERWKGLEVNGFLLEEASELHEDAFNKSIERAGSWLIPPTEEDPAPKQPSPYVLVTFNPCKNWPRKKFYEPWKSGTIQPPFYFLPTTIADNPYATEEYKESLKYLPPEEYKRFVEGEWDFVDDPDQLIQSEWVWNAVRNVEPNRRAGPKKLGVDVARYGDDWTTLALVEGNALMKLQEERHLSTDRVATLVLNEAAGLEVGMGAVKTRNRPIDGENIHIDAVGLGAGAVDICRKAGLPVREFIAGAKPYPREFRKPIRKGEAIPDWVTVDNSVFKFANLRSQAWWEFREKLRLGLVCLSMRGPNGQEIPIPEKLVADLAAPRYEIRGDKVISVESKDSIKLRLGRSTDDGDAVVMAFFDFPPETSTKPSNANEWRVVRR